MRIDCAINPLGGCLPMLLRWCQGREGKEPVHLLSCIAQAYERLDLLVDALAAELDRAEDDNAARRIARAA